MTETLPIPKQSTPSSLRCRKIGPEDRRCGSPALRGESFCYHHHQTRRPVENLRHRRARQSTFSLPQPNSRGDIQQALGTVMVRIAANDIDLRRAGLLLYALQIANSNLNHHQHQNTAKTKSDYAEQSAAESAASSDSEKEPEITQSPSTADTSHQSPLTSDTSHEKCHPERSAAKSKDLRLDLLPQSIPENQPQSTQPDIHFGSGTTPDRNHSQTKILNPNHDFTPPSPVWRSISNATGAALLDVLARSEGAEPLLQSPEDRQPEQTVISTGAKRSGETCFSTHTAMSATAQTTHDAEPQPDPCEPLSSRAADPRPLQP